MQTVEINLRLLSGKSVGHVSIAPAATGRDLLEEVRVLLGQPPGVLTLLAESASVSDESSIGQGMDAAVVQCLVTEATDEQVQTVKAAVLAGRELEANMW